MAQKTEIVFIDDLDGSAAETTIRFGLDGVEYEIDLNAAHASELRNAMETYIAIGRKVGGTPGRTRPAGKSTTAAGPSPSEVREWAKGQGIEVKDRGRVPAELIVKFKAATDS
jgi:hypothetical protein